MVQCPSCHSYNESGAGYCSQCGDSLLKARERRPLGGWVPGLLKFSAGLLAILMIVVTIVAFIPEPEDRAPVPLQRVDRRKIPAREIDRVEHTRPKLDGAPSGPVDDSGPLEPSVINKMAREAIVVLELRSEDDRALRDIHGVLVSSGGVVLSRFRPLLGAYGGNCRLAALGNSRVEILGLSHYDELRDLSLVRVNTGDRELGFLPILEDPPDSIFEKGDSLHLFSGYRLKTGAISEPRFVTSGGVVGLRLAREPPIVPETFLAIDPYGYLLGFCRPLVGGLRVLEEGETVQDKDFRVFVDPALSLVPQLEFPVVLTLQQLTRQFFEGTFADLMKRGDRAYRRKNWGEAIDLFLRAEARTRVDGVPQEDVDRLYSRLRESYLQELERLQGARRLSEAADLAEAALEYLPQDTTLWSKLAEARFGLGLLRAGIDALLEIKDLEGGEEVGKRLESAYRQFASQALSQGNGSRAERVYIEGLQEAPTSGHLHFELAKLYQQWEAYDDAIRLFQRAAELDRSLADRVAVYLDKIDDILKRRDAVIIPLAEGTQLISTKLTIDDRHEFPFIVDTGATHTTLPSSFAVEMGYNPQRGDVVQVGTAGGVVTGHRIRLGSVSLGGYTVRNLYVIVLPDSVGLRSGLLGLNFLQYFKYSVDAKRGEFRLERN